MAVKNITQRKRRHLRIRKKVKGTKERPRLSVYRSLRNLFVQLVDDATHTTLVCVSTLDKTFKGQQVNGGNVKAASLLGELVSKKAQEKGIKKIVFDRGGYKFFGRIKALAESLKKGGLEF